MNLEQATLLEHIVSSLIILIPVIATAILTIRNGWKLQDVHTLVNSNTTKAMEQQNASNVQIAQLSATVAATNERLKEAGLKTVLPPPQS